MKKRFLLLGAILGVAGVATAAVNVTVNGSSYSIPQKNEKGWGDNVTSWIQAISANTLQPSGGLFSLSADIDLGAAAGLKSLYFKSRSSNIAASGQWRLANTDVIGFRNAANTGDLGLTPGASDGQLNYNGVLLDTVSAANTLTNKKLSDSTTSIVNAVDPTKLLVFSLGGNSTGISLTLAPTQTTSQTLSIPNVGTGDAVVTNNTAATLTNKTLALGSNSVTGTASQVAVTNVSGVLGTAASLANTLGGTGQNSSAWTGIPHVSTGTWSASAIGLASSDVTGTLPIANGGTGQTTAAAAFTALAPTAGASGNVMTSNGSSWVSSAPAASPSQSYEQSNLGLSASVATNALTIALKQSDGVTDASAGSPVKIGFRNATATTGAYTQRLVTAALSITVPSSASLGQVSAVNQYVWVYGLDDAGTIDLCVSGVSVFQQSTVQSVTQVSASATSGSTLYCGSAHTGAKPIRLIGRLLVNEATAGTWASAPTEVSLFPTPTPNITDCVSYSPTLSGFGVTSGANFCWSRNGNFVHVHGGFTVGTAAASVGTISLPSINLDATKLGVQGNTSGQSGDIVGWYGASGNVDGNIITAPGTSTSVVYIGGSRGAGSGASTTPAANMSAIITNGSALNIDLWLAIQGWSTYGP